MAQQPTKQSFNEDYYLSKRPNVRQVLETNKWPDGSHAPPDMTAWQHYQKFGGAQYDPTEASNFQPRRGENVHLPDPAAVASGFNSGGQGGQRNATGGTAYGVQGYGGGGGYSYRTDPISQFAERTYGRSPMTLQPDPGQTYLQQNPGVRRAVRDDDITSVTGARQHYEQFGQDEGRSWPGLTSQQNVFDPGTGQGAMAPTRAGRDPEDDLDNAIAAQLGGAIQPQQSQQQMGGGMTGGAAPTGASGEPRGTPAAAQQASNGVGGTAAGAVGGLGARAATAAANALFGGQGGGGNQQRNVSQQTSRRMGGSGQSAGLLGSGFFDPNRDVTRGGQR